ncbi:MAG: hypothetical protein ACPLI6_03890 [Candidatus Hydrothermia bacterium]
MNFLNPLFIYLLPLSMLPLFSLFFKSKPQKIKIVSWLFLIRYKELDRRRKLHRDLIILLRIFILLTILTFLAKPVPNKYKFDKIFVERSAFTARKNLEIKKIYKNLVSFYGNRVELRSISDVNEYSLSGESDRRRFYYFGTHLWIMSIINEVMKHHWDTVAIRDAGIFDLDFSTFPDSLRIGFFNYNLGDTNFNVTLKNTRGSFTRVLKIPQRSKVYFSCPIESGIQEVELEANDDVPVDNRIYLNLSTYNRNFYFSGQNKVIETFFANILRKTSSPQFADVLVYVNRLPATNETNKIVFLFTNSRELCNALELRAKLIPEARIEGLSFNNIIVFNGSKPTSLKDLLIGVKRGLKVGGNKLIVFGVVPDPAENDLLYVPEFWMDLLREIKVFPTIAYSYDDAKIGKVLNDTLYLIRIPDVRLEDVSFANLSKKHIPIYEILRYLKIVRAVFLAGIALLILLEAALTKLYFG